MASSKVKHGREEKSHGTEIPLTANTTQLKHTTNNSVDRLEILKALSSYPTKTQKKRSDPEQHADDGNTQKPKQTQSPSDKNPIVKMIYPNTPNRHSHKYTYKDLMADRKRLEQKINYIKNMFSANDSTTDDPVRIRRRSESDRTANKIAKMFLTLSAVNGLPHKRRSRCRHDDSDEDYDGDRVQDVWEKERRNSPNRKATSSNAERYKVKKWIEFMKNERSSGKTCPCMGNVHGDDSDAFPLEQKLPKDYFLMERSSEESSETYSPYYHSRDKPYRRNSNGQDNKLKALAKNSKKKLDLPLTDLELYRSRAKQILQNAEEILDRIKEEEEKRLAAPSLLMNQLKELTSRIQSDPRNNENDLIRKIQKNLGWKPLAKSKDGTDSNTFIDNVKSYILDPYEKAKALTDESTKMLSSYLLRNLGKMQQSSEEQDARQADDGETQVYFGQVPTKEDEKPVPANLAKADSQLLSKSKQELQNWEDTISTIMQGGDETVKNGPTPEDIFKKRMEDIIKEQQKRLKDSETYPNSDDSRRVTDSDDNRNSKTKPGIKFLKPEKHNLKQKEENEKDKPKLGGNRGPEKLTIRHPIRPKPKTVHEHVKPKHPSAGRHHANTKDRKVHPLKRPKGVAREKEDPETADEQELQREIFDEIARNLDENPTDPQVQQNLKTVDEENERNSNETPLQATLDEKERDETVEMEKPEQQQQQTGNSAPKSTNSEEDNSENSKLVGSQQPEVPDVESPGPRNLPDYNFLSGEDETSAENLQEAVGEASAGVGEPTKPETEEPGNKSAADNLDEVIDPLLRKTEQLETELENASGEDNLEKAIESLLREAEEPETELTGSEPNVGDKQLTDNQQPSIVEAMQDSSEIQPEQNVGSRPKDDEQSEQEDRLNLKLQPQDEGVKAALKQQESSEEVGRSESEEDTDDKDDVRSPKNSEKRPEEEVKAVLEEDSTETDLKAAKTEYQGNDSVEDSEETPLREALEKENDEDESPLREVLEKEEEMEDGSPLGKTMKKQQDEKTLEDKEEESRSRKALNKKEEDKYDNPLRKSLGNTEADEAPLRKTMGSMEDEDDDGDDTKGLNEEENDTPLRKTLASKEDENADDGDETPLRKTLESKEDEDADDDDETPLRKTLESNEDEDTDDEIPLRKSVDSKKENTDTEDPLIKAFETLSKTSESNEDNGGIPLRKSFESRKPDDDDGADDPLRMSKKEQEEENDTPLRKTLDSNDEEDADDDEIPLRKSFDNKKQDVDTEDPLIKAFKKKEDENGSLRKTSESTEDDGGIPLRKSFESRKPDDDADDPLRMSKNEQDENDTPLRKSLDNRNEDDDTEVPLRKGFKQKEEENDTPLRKTLERKEDENADDGTPLRKTLASKEDEGSGEDDDETPLRKSFEDFEDPLRMAFKKKEEENDTPLRKTLENKEDANDDDDETPLRKPLKTGKEDEDPLKMSMNEQEDENDTSLRKTLESKEDDDGNDDEAPLRNSMNEQEDENDTPLRKTLESKEDEDADDGTPLRKSSENKKDDTEEDPLRMSMKEQEEENDTPLRKTLDSKEAEEDDDEIPLRKSFDNKKEDIGAGDPLRMSMNEQEEESDTPLRKTLDGKEDEDADDDEIPLRKSLDHKKEEIDAEDPLRMSMNEQEEENDTPLRKTLESNEDTDGGIPLRKSFENKKDDTEDPLRSSFENQKNEGGDSNEDETPLRKSFQSSEVENDNDTDDPLRKTFEKEQDSNPDDDDDDETPLRETLESTKDKQIDETPLREALESEEKEYDDNQAQDNKQQTILQQANTQLEESEEDEETPLREAMNQENRDPDSDRTGSSEEYQQNARDEQPLRATLNEQENDVDGENSDETALKAVNLTQDIQDSDTKDSEEVQNEDNLRSEHPTEGDSSEEADVYTKDEIQPEVGGESLLKSADNQNEHPETSQDGDNLRAEQTSEEMPNESLENVREEKPEDAKSGEALRAAFEDLLEHANDDVKQAKPQLTNEEVQEPQTGSDETLQATLEDADATPNEAESVEATLLGTEESSGDEDTPLRVSLNQDSDDTENATLENELDSPIQETPVKSVIDPQKETEIDTQPETETVRAEAPSPKEDDPRENVLQEDNPLAGNPETRSSLPDLLQQPPKQGALKVPKSIAQIMKDLDGRGERDDITSVQNLNPDKIDDIIDKIDEAEQQNLLEQPEVDCRKQCACADEIDTRSRNIGRYEIVKDFLHWMKDLQLNRVLTDD